MKNSEVSTVVLGQIVFIAIWFWFGIDFMAWLAIIVLVITLLNITFSGDFDD